MTVAFHRIVWCWYAVPVLASLMLFARVLLHEFELLYCNDCNSMQVIIVVWFAVLPAIALFFSYGLGWVMSRWVPRPVLVAHLVAGLPVLWLLWFFLVNIGQYWD